MTKTNVQERRLQYREETRRTILDAAEELLVQGGLDAFSMRRLAERCGCTPPTLYHYFGDKDALIDSLLEERLQSLVAELRAVSESSDVIAYVCELGRAFAHFGIRNPSHYQLLSMPRDEDDLPPSGEEARNLFLAPLEALAAREGLGEEGAELLKQSLWCLLHGSILLQTNRLDESWSPDLLEVSVKALVKGAIGELKSPTKGSA